MWETKKKITWMKGGGNIKRVGLSEKAKDNTGESRVV
jgi:hypothetical protein